MFIYPLLIELHRFQRFHSGSSLFVSVLLKRVCCEPGEPGAAVFGRCRGESLGPIRTTPGKAACARRDALQRFLKTPVFLTEGAHGSTQVTAA